MTTVLFVCVHNAGRSVMAEAFFDAAAPQGTKALSAGTEPRGAPHPEVVEAMREIGIDVSHHVGRALSDAMVHQAARIITMGCAVDADVCPSMLYADTEDWALPDPKGRPMDEVRAIRDEIRSRVDVLLAQLTWRSST
jgi:arsenate reductase